MKVQAGVGLRAAERVIFSFELTTDFFNFG
jgi:hypothetical protein